MIFWAKNNAIISPNHSQKSELHSMMSPDNPSLVKNDYESIKTIALLVPTFVPYTFEVEKTAYVFQFENLEEAVRIISQEKVERGGRARSSQKSFLKQASKESKASLLLSGSSTYNQAPQVKEESWRKSKKEEEEEPKLKIKRMLSPTVEETIEEEDHRLSDHVKGDK